MAKYRKKPIIIEAFQTDKEIDIETLEGTMHASVGDYIITGVNGEQYPCKPDIFAKTYIKCGQANKIRQVAALFNKKLGETFGVFKDECGFAYAKFTEDGLRMVHSNGKIFTRNDIEDFGFSVDLEDLIIGSAVIVDVS